MFKNSILKILIHMRLYPHILYILNPFKIYEFKELLRDVTFSGDETILDIGCGPGLQTMLLGKKCRKVIGIDILEADIAHAKQVSGYANGRMHAEFRCARIQTAGFEDACFDKVFSICVIEHVRNYAETLRQAWRVLKNNGQMIFSVDALETIENGEFVAKHKKRHAVAKYFRKEELQTLLEAMGFKNIQVYPIFRSAFAKKLFIKDIINRRRGSRVRSLFNYLLLKYKEKHCRNSHKGLFLIAKACKDEEASQMGRDLATGY